VGDFELARRHYMYTFNTTTTVNVTNDAKGIKMKLFRERLGVSNKGKKCVQAGFQKVI
jgi:hypothetical protein